MIIFKDHAKIIKLLDQYTFAKDVLEAFPRERRHTFSRRLIELSIMGLVEIKDSQIFLTKAGKLISDAIIWLESHFEPLDKLELPKDILVNSQIITMLEVIEKTNYIPSEWESFLKERYLISDRKVNHAGELILEAYRKAVPIIYLTSDIAEFLSGLPPGPADYKVLVEYREAFGYGENAIYALEALRLIKISPPWRGKVVYNLTRSGKIIKDLLYEIPLYKPLMLVNGTIRVLLSKGVKELLPKEKESLEQYGFFDAESQKLTNLGAGISKAYDLLREPYAEIFPLYISLDEIKVLTTIEKALEINKTNPEIYPTIDYLKGKSGVSDVGFILHLLESKNFIERTLWKNKEAFLLTEYGETVLKVFGDIKRTIPSDAVKALTFATRGDVPRPDWVELAEEYKLIGKGSLTYRGEVMLNLCRRIKRKLITTIYDTAILLKTPSRKSITRSQLIRDVISLVSERIKTEEKIVDIAISEAESKGLIIVYQNDAVMLTEIGERLKTIIQMAKTDVIKGMKVSITPLLVNVLRVIKENEDEFAKAWREKEELTSKIIETIRKELKIPDELIKEQVTTLRGMGLIGRRRGGRILTEPGEMLVETASKLISIAMP